MATIASAQERIRLATTTSTENSGLLQKIIPEMEKACECKIDVIVSGTGRALAYGKSGEVDLVMVHASDAEITFVKEGFGKDRTTFMVNDFVILGPVSDPAKISGMTDGAKAFDKIALTKSTFISRGDDSGTHKKETATWKRAEIKPSGQWYLEAGQGMGAIITIADNKYAYTLADRGTYLSRRKGIALKVLVQGDPAFANPYSMIAIDPKRHPHVKYEKAKKVIAWLCTKSAKDNIAAFRLNGEKLFVPIHPCQSGLEKEAEE